MAQNLLIRECPTGVSQDVASYWHQKLGRLERLLRRFGANKRHLHFSFVCAEGGYEARTVLTLPTRMLVARSDATTPDHRVAVDRAIASLTQQLRQLRLQLHENSVQTRRRRRETDVAAAEPHLEEFHRHRDRDGFFEVLTPLLRQLRDHARRELTIAQIEGAIRSGELSVQDLLDEVLIRAWDDWDQRPTNQPLDRWLVKLLHETLDEYGFVRPDETGKSRAAAGEGSQSVSLDARVPVDDPRFHVENGWEIEQNPDFPYKEENEWVGQNDPNWPFLNPLTRDDVPPAEDSPEPSQHFAAEEQRRLILDELNRFPRAQRRAFTLHVLEGWSIDEIAQDQRRPPGEVRADIDTLRTALRRRPAAAERPSAAPGKDPSHDINVVGIPAPYHPDTLRRI